MNQAQAAKFMQTYGLEVIAAEYFPNTKKSFGAFLRGITTGDFITPKGNFTGGRGSTAQEAAKDLIEKLPNSATYERFTANRGTRGSRAFGTFNYTV